MMTQEKNLLFNMMNMKQYISTFRKVVLTMIALLTVGVGEIWADDIVSGKYYRIYANEEGRDISGQSLSKRQWYLWPSAMTTDNKNAKEYPDNNIWAVTYDFISASGFHNNGVDYDDYDETYSIWQVTKITDQSETYYQLYNIGTKRYLVWDKTGQVGRAVHLEKASTITEWEKTYFKYTSSKVLTPKGGTVSFNSYGGNKQCLTTVNGSHYPQLNNSNNGLIGLWGSGQWNFVEADYTPPTSFTVNNDGSVTITSTNASSIYYTTDDSTPTTSSTPYNDPISASDIANATGSSIKAVALEGGVLSPVSVLSLVNYTYKIVNNSNGVAITHTVKQPVGLVLDGSSSIPEEIRSTYLSDETVTFYKFATDYALGASIDEALLTSTNVITSTPDNANIYVKYTLTNLENKDLDLSGARPFNVKNSSGNFLYDISSGEMGVGDTGASNTKRNYLWHVSGGDPYAAVVQNAYTSKYLTYASSSFGLSTDLSGFMVKSVSRVNPSDATKLNVVLRNTAGNEVTITINTVTLPISFTLIDKAGNVIESGINANNVLELPDAWKSPLVSTYHYWKTEGTQETRIEEITDISQVGDNNIIHVTYDVSDAIDLDGRNLLGVADKTGKTYRLKFLNGTSFNQEDGKDGVMSTTRQAIYPYSNGDAALYLYGEERWTEQLESGASTRDRWLWYLEPGITSPNVILDPYHVKISSYKTQTSYKVTSTETRNFHSYLRTYIPEGHGSVVTGVTNDNPLVNGGAASAAANSSLATEYMILGTSTSSMKLVTTKSVTGGAVNGVYGTRQTVNSFEQYWKNNPTAYNILVNAGKPVVDGTSVTADLSDAQKAVLTAKDWHVYSAWANAADWSSNSRLSKNFTEGKHWFQTVNMGETFTLEETELTPMLILLDQHGWEIVRLPLPSGPTDPNRAARYAGLHKYSSPMVERYHFWKTGSKVPGYHKFTVSDYATVSATDLTEYTADELGRADLSVSTANLPDYESQAFVNGKERDWYVTYDVKPEYARAYTGAATEAATGASPFLLKMNNSYARLDGTSLTTDASAPDDLEAYDTNKPFYWYLRPNFNIDEEMGYRYDVEVTDEDNKTTKPDKAATEATYFAEGKNGFDPYNLQIQSVQNTDLYFTAITSGSAIVRSVWIGTSSSVSTLPLTTRQTVEGQDQAELKITNATFMVVDDGNGNMRLMPRFDNTMVVQGFTTLARQADAEEANDEGTRPQTFYITQVPQVVHSTDEITAMGGYYIMADNFTVNGSVGTQAYPFKGTIDGNFVAHEANHPLFAYAEDAIIKNVVLDNVSISDGSTVSVGGSDKEVVGAICNYASGETRIYNCGVLATGNTYDANENVTSCSSTISGGDYVGSIVGLLDGYSRVINCFSYANVSASSDGGGIVGYNNYSSTNQNIHTMVMNCMYYGNVSDATNISPVYGGYEISNVGGTGLNNFNYYSLKNFTSTITKYNDALGGKELHLKRFEFYRNLLNSNRDLAAWYATGSVSDPYDKMAKWVLDKEIGKYPILKVQGKYPSVINYDPEYTFDPEGNKVSRSSVTEANQGKNLGTLTVNITVGSNAPVDAAIRAGSLSITLPIIDKDTTNYNFNYYKVQLPYYNEVGTNNYTNDASGKARVATGWMITSVTGGTAGSYTTGTDATKSGDVITTPYNFADRNCTAKDIYVDNDLQRRIFPNGGYFNVPEGVTAISIEPYWSKAVFLSDPNYDKVYNSGYGATDVTAMGARPTTMTINGQSQTVYTSLGTALNQLSDGNNPFSQAVVLVGNYHLRDASGAPFGDSKPCTYMSIDQNGDNEPDYSLLLNFQERKYCPAIRFDFLNLIPLGIAQKVFHSGAPQMPNIAIFKPKGWFEVTTTCITEFTEFEYDSDSKTEAPVIFLGGHIGQIISQNHNTGYHPQRTNYILLGDNVMFDDFCNGMHSDKKLNTRHCPISVTGGEYKNFYLSGLYRPDVNGFDDNAECYINGGKFGELAGAAHEKINGDVFWLIDHADITNFFGGGINAANPIKGNIDITMNNSRVELFCGGPKFGDMSANKTVTTSATGSTFGTFFGAGYGGTSLNRVIKATDYKSQTYGWANWAKNYTRSYSANDNGISTSYETEYFAWAGGTTVANVGRFYVNFASLSLANTHNVTSTLNGCTVENNFYGGGNLGAVNGDVTSTLTGTTVKGNAFGAGFSASVPTVSVYMTTTFTHPSYNTNIGVFYDAVYPEGVDYTWTNGGGLSTSKPFDDTNHLIYTDVDLTGLGAVTGNCTLNINGTSVIGDADVANSGNVFGGGEESDVKCNAGNADGNTHLNIAGTAMVYGSVYAAGKGLDSNADAAKVGGNTNVTITADAQVIKNVYGGAEMASVGDADEVKGDVTVDYPLGYKTGTATVVINGNAQIGTVDNCMGENGYGYVYGSGHGKSGSTYAERTFVKNTDVTIGGAAQVRGSVFGSGENGHVRHDTKVTIAETCTIGTPLTTYDDGNGGTVTEYAEDDNGVGVNIYRGNVYGGGRGIDADDVDPDAAFSVTSGRVYGNTNVVITGGTIYHGVFGGGSLASVGTTNGEGNYTEGTGSAVITISGGTIGDNTTEGKADSQAHPGINNGFVFGSGRGLASSGSASDMYADLAYVHDTEVSVSGGTIYGCVFGGGANGHVKKDTEVNISGGIIGAELTDAETAVADDGTGKHLFHGNVYGGGRGVDPWDEGGHRSTTAGRVYGNTEVNISGGVIRHAVYGGGSLAVVGNPTYTEGDITAWPFDESTNKNGVATINITGGYIGNVNADGTAVSTTAKAGYNNGHVYGSGRGMVADNIGADSQYAQMGYVYRSVVNVGATGTPQIYGSVFGSGENGHIYENTFVTVSGGTIGAEGINKYAGNVYGGGRGVDHTASGAAATISETAGKVGMNTNVTITGGTVWNDVYGGGSMASVGNAVEVAVDGHYSTGLATVMVQGTAAVHGSVYGAGRGKASTDAAYVQAAYNKNTDVEVKGTAVIYGDVFGGGNAGHVRKNTEVTVSETPTIKGNVYGGGAGSVESPTAGIVYHNVVVNIQGGTIEKDVYGGGAIANTNVHDARYSTTVDCRETCTTQVNLTGGLIKGDAYGGGKGTYYVPNQANPVYDQSEWTAEQKATYNEYGAQVYGDVTVTLNGTAFIPTTEKDDAENDVAKSGRVFGCNNFNGSPKGKVLVHVLQTVPVDASGASRAKAKGTYDVEAVYGGGNLAGYEPYYATLSATGLYTTNHDATSKPIQVVIEGCEETSIKNVYGGGNAADVPATDVLILGCYEINEVFGGGNGKDKIKPLGTWIDNFGADVGAFWYQRENYDGTEGHTYGTGIASTSVYGGTVHSVYGGSNTLGNVWVSSDVTVDKNSAMTSCELSVGEVFGGGKNADMTGGTNIVMGCMPDEWIADVYAGARNADVAGDVGLTLTSGKFYRVFGGNKDGGKLQGSITLNIEETGGCDVPLVIGELYGGGNLAGYSIYGYNDDGTPRTQAQYDALSAEYKAANPPYANPQVNVKAFTSIGAVYGGGYQAQMIASPTVNINEVKGSHYAETRAAETLENVPIKKKNAETGDIEDATITISLPAHEANKIGAIGNVYGGGNLAEVVGDATINIGTKTTVEFVTEPVHLRTSAETPLTKNASGFYEVTLEGANITGNVYGGGNQAVISGDAKVFVCAEAGEGDDVYSVVNPGTARILISGNVYGAGYGASTEVDNTTVVMGAGTIKKSIYGGGELGLVNENTKVFMMGGELGDEGTNATANGNIYGGGLGSSAVINGTTNVFVSGGTVNNNVFGGGSQADVKQNVNVTISGGKVVNDVYGGGALANTNTENWNFTSEDDYSYVDITASLVYVYKEKEVTVGESVTGLYTKSGDVYTAASGTAVEGTTYYEYDAPYVAGYYTESDGVYTLVTYGKQDPETRYYKRMVAGTWADGKNDASTGTVYKTAVTLTGGLIGNAYGGGLGNSTTAANVYGDVTVTVNQEDTESTAGVIFTQRTENAVIGGISYPTPVTGRVFGCNNLNGTPTGNVTVHVYKTRQVDADYNIIAGHGSSNRKYTYELQAVYGGGNLSDYLPADGKKTSVIIDGCDETSIEKVYGGGNSAIVPETDVLINGSYDIGYAFGGGNGDKPIKKEDGNWYENEGAIVIGLAKVVCHGGKIGQVFGGGDSKGSCGTTSAVTEESGDCPLHITRLYGAGNAGDVSSVNIVLAACSGNAIEYVHGGSYNAHVDGDVNLTITSGILKNVYGGNDARGGIKGKITVNIEETNGCNPIIIQNLVGGGNEAPYPGTYNDGGVEVPWGTHGKITINVKSCTRIDNIYGGSYKAEADADTYVNINLVKGNKAGTTVDIPKEFDYIPNISDITSNADGKTIHCTIDDAIGTIGNVFGGGNMGKVKGDATVNIMNSNTVALIKRNGSGKILATDDTVLDAENGSNITDKEIDYTTDNTVLGVNITGNVYGGGEMADVTGNTNVNICAAYDTEWKSVTEGASEVKIAGNVFGGGKGAADSFTCASAMVGVDGANTGSESQPTYGTNVRIGNGTIGSGTETTGTVYGGGEIGRVEWNTHVTIGLTPAAKQTSAPEIKYNVFGAGKGVSTHGYAALVRGNSTVVVQQDAKIGHSVYGGGQLASVGRYKVKTAEGVPDDAPDNLPIGMPYSLVSDYNGNCYVTVQGNAEVGPDNMSMTKADGPDDTGHVFGAGKGVLPYEDTARPGRMTVDNTMEYYDDDEEGYLKYVETLALATQTDVTIGGNAFIKGSVYGGSKNGHVQHNTEVTIQDNCQIGNGEGINRRYTTEEWAYDGSSDAKSLKECASWPFGTLEGTAKYAPYDKYADASGNYTNGTSARGGRPTADDGHTFYGNVFGGGSGNTPYAPGKWHLEAGSVGGNTTVTITGGHILTSVYGGNEMTNVGTYDAQGNVISGGVCTVSFGGTATLGVPRTLKQIKEHPVTCYLFGSGKGDQRTFFNTWTDVASVDMNITGGWIYGSVFGGGEDGHVMGDIDIDVTGPVKIGTWGTSYVDGNIFGGGRGFSGEALTAGSVGGNINLNITAGTMLGSIYGGGRLASVGTHFTNPEANDYGQLQEDEGETTHGHITINISGGTIGGGTVPSGSESYGDTKYSGNVFGASMGRVEHLDGSVNPLWPKLAQAKSTAIAISGGSISRNVYGGSEFGTVRENATVTIEGGTIGGNVFGGGYGSADYTTHTLSTVYWNSTTTNYVYTPMQWAGIVGGNTTISMTGGTVAHSIYGGGELASVGLIDYSVTAADDGDITIDETKYNYNNITKHSDANSSFALSWPYKFIYAAYDPAQPTVLGGKATITISDGRVGEYVFGGGKGKVELGITDVSQHRYAEAFLNNVRETEVNINYASTPESDDGSTTQCIAKAVYGGAEDGHVYENAVVNIRGGLIGYSVYGAGKGISTYQGYLKDPSTKKQKSEKEAIFSWLAGKVYGNTTISMTGGHVVRNIYGGGYNGSVGKGNYAGGTDGYYSDGYGEKAGGNLWDSSNENSVAYLESGITTVNITAGTVGTAGAVYDDLPTGQVYGACRGRAAQDVLLDPRHEYAPNFYLGYCNKAVVIIGDDTHAPIIYGSVYGGGRDGHVRNLTTVTINNGTIGEAYTEGADITQTRWRNSGNVYGSGSGMGTWDETTHHGMSSGSVTRKTTVTVNGGTIYQNVYGGGAMSSVGPPKSPSQDDYAARDISLCQVNINGGIIGTAAGVAANYGGTVYGASRGGDNVEGESYDDYATVLWTEVNINNGSIAGNVYGGGQVGRVKKDINVNLKGGTITYDAYGGGRGTETVGADVGGNVTVKLNENVGTTAKGCIVRKIYGCNDLKGTPKGHVLVHVFATQHKNQATIADKYTKFDKLDNYTISSYSGLETLATTVDANVSAYTTVLTGSGTDDEKTTALANMIEAIAEKKYDVQAVYGGGDLAPYEPTSETEVCEVIIDGCELTSIQQVYGSGNAASASGTLVTINGTHEIHELFGGGNGKDNYELSSVWYENPGANVGYHNYTHYVKVGETGYNQATHGSGTKADPYKAITNDNATNKEYRQANYRYGTGEARTEVIGGRIHNVYGGSNQKGNISTTAVSVYENSADCPSVIDHTYGAGKNAEIDGAVNMVLDCVEYMGQLFGGSTSGDVNNDVNLTITNGHFGQVFGGNREVGKILGSITVNVQEQGCQPIVIGELYGGGYKAPYSIYGYKNTGTAETPVWEPRTKSDFDTALQTALNGVPDVKEKKDSALIANNLYGFPKADPRINIISATKIGSVYGGGYEALVVGSPRINVNMEQGKVIAKYAKGKTEFDEGSHTRDDGHGAYEYYVESIDGSDNAILKIGTIDYIYGGGNKADVYGDATIEIGTGTTYNASTGKFETITPARNAAFINGSVFGGGRLGHVGQYTLTDGKPTDCIYGGKTSITVSNGEIGPDNMTMPQDYGHVFGGGQGTVDLYYDQDMTDEAKQTAIAALSESELAAKITTVNNLAFVDSTSVIINGTAFIKGSVYGGSESGHVLHNTGVKIQGGQIGNGYAQMADDGTYLDLLATPVTPVAVNRPYTDAEWEAGHLITTSDPSALQTLANTYYKTSLPEAASWKYGRLADKNIRHAPYDPYANEEGKYPDGTSADHAYSTGDDGHTFYGNVFAGGSGYYPYAPGKWIEKAGQVEGDSWVEVSGGHILTSLYGGNEMTDVLGDTHVIMTDGTLGVPRTLGQIEAHPVTCYLFGGGRGDQRIFFNKRTNVQDVYVNITGGKIYGSAFGGGEDGHVLGNITMNVGKAGGTGPYIGTLGTSYVDGNIFGGGRGFSGEAITQGNVGGSIDLTIQGGTMLGSIYGGGRLGSVGYGLYATTETGKYAVMREDNLKDDGTDGTVMYPKGRGHINITISGGTIGNDHEYAFIQSSETPTGNLKNTKYSTKSFKEKTGYVADTNKEVMTEATEAQNIQFLEHTRGGNVYAGGMGRQVDLNGKPLTAENGYNDVDDHWKKLGCVKSTKLTIKGGTIKSSVFGGGEFGAVAGHQKGDENKSTEIVITGGTIGTAIMKNGIPQYTFGSVYGGGMGTEEHFSAEDEGHGGDVHGNTWVTIGDAEHAPSVAASVYGGGEMAAVDGNTNVSIVNGSIGLNKVRQTDGYVLFGGITMGNVFGGGKGLLGHTLAGVVKGNTNVSITGGNIYHNVYGGGALASVGTFTVADGVNPSYIPKDIPYGWTAGGATNISITGGNIGINGRDNGMVFGSSRGDIAAPEGTPIAIDPYDKLAWVENSNITIGTSGSTNLASPHIAGSVYGGGENGHNEGSTAITVYSGTIGITDTNDRWYSFSDNAINTLALTTRGNVYGGGCGTDTYTSGGVELHNPKSGMVAKNTVVNIRGGHIGHSVYGGGSMGSVGTISNAADTLATAASTTKHTDLDNSFGLSWPYKFVFAENTGKATVNVTGGHIGTRDIDGGDVYGSARGEAGDRYATMHLAYVGESEVNINYPSTPAESAIPNITTNFTIPCITGSVHGSGENGYVYGDTHVTLNNGLIGHSLYGAGRGKGTYQVTLNELDGSGTYTDSIYSLISGKVFGNTYVTMNNGRVLRNVYGGGNMGSVGKGNYASGADDYYPAGYGETLTGNLWDGDSDNSQAFLNSGKTTVKVFNGTVGYVDSSNPANSMKNNLPYGNVFGGSAGEAAPNILEDNRYLYCPAFFSGYVNETDVTIGGYSCTKAYDTYAVDSLITADTYNTFSDADKAKWTLVGPTIYASVYGGGQDGHVRRDTKVNVYSGTIGLPFTAANKTLLQTEDVEAVQWLHRGNVYGAGSGISKYKFDFNADGDTSDKVTYRDRATLEEDYSTSAGSVTRFTEVNVKGGTVYRNVYGGGSLASVGPPTIPPTRTDLADKKGDATHGVGWQSMCTVNIASTIGTPTGFTGAYGGNVFGASRGMESLDAESFGSVMWTIVNILNGADIKGNVFGGGDAGMVKRDTEVNVGGTAE